MKKFPIILFLAIAGILFIGANNASALAYLGADINILGINYSDISSIENWTVNGNSIYTGWCYTGNEEYGWIEYQTYLTEGNWNVGLNIINHGYLGNEDWYSHFEVMNGFGNELMWIPASDTEENYGYVNIDVANDGMYSFRYTWLNDEYDTSYEQVHDANIQVNSAFFDNTETPAIPEPTTVLLMGTGFLGLAILRKIKA